ncbi:hypothetical protein [Paenibacillus sp. MBLB4367]|uniref:hypothetical protein n=1 Tax=Paenibacillus sp. MBLB4367 TaxID=3384767 RepID=UPI0039080F90
MGHRRDNRHRRIVYSLLLLFLAATVLGSFPAHAQAKGPNDVEFFDVKQGKVVKQVPLEKKAYKEAEKWLKSIDGLVSNAVINPAQGIVWKVPLNPPIQVDNQWFKGPANVVFVFLEKPDAKPYLLIFAPDGKPLLFTFKHKLKPFVKKYDVKALFD